MRVRLRWGNGEEVLGGGLHLVDGGVARGAGIDTITLTLSGSFGLSISSGLKKRKNKNCLFCYFSSLDDSDRRRMRRKTMQKQKNSGKQHNAIWFQLRGSFHARREASEIASTGANSANLHRELRHVTPAIGRSGRFNRQFFIFCHFFLPRRGLNRINWSRNCHGHQRVDNHRDCGSLSAQVVN